MSDRSYHVILNSKAGTAAALGLTSETLAARFDAAGLTASIDADDGVPIEERIAAALAGPADVIVAAGGDGTVRSIAEAMVGTDKILAALPLGTYNALSKDMGVPLDLDAAIASLQSMQAGRMDVGEVNGKVFLHNVLIGVVPGITAGRELVRTRRNPTAWVGFFRFMLRRLARSHQMAVAIEADTGLKRVERMHAIVVANNAYDHKPGAFLTRQCVDAGILTLYTVKRLRVADAVRLTAEMLAGTWHTDEAVTIQSLKSVTIHSKHASLLVTIDGEVQTMTTPLKFGVRPLGLSVLALPVPQASMLAPAAPTAETVEA